MSGHVLFQMWGPFRQSLIDGHMFYVEQARKRLLSQFDDIETEADKAAEEWLKRSSHSFDPERHDPSDFYEAANDAGIEFYQLLSDMREQTRLSVVAGMFHEWEKQLRDWLVREIGHWHRGDEAALAIWKAKFDQIFDLLEHVVWKVRSAPYLQTLNACRHVVNVYKHGDGKSLAVLKQNFPEYLDNPLKDVGVAYFAAKHIDHTRLRVSDEQLQAFSDAIVAFWRDVPENVFASRTIDAPGWFEKAILKDRDNQNSGGGT